MSILDMLYPKIPNPVLAAKLDVHRTYIWQLRSGDREMNDGIRYRICKDLKLTPQKLEKFERDYEKQMKKKLDEF